jgi:hypothetical protein
MRTGLRSGGQEGQGRKAGAWACGLWPDGKGMRAGGECRVDVGTGGWVGYCKAFIADGIYLMLAGTKLAHSLGCRESACRPSDGG